jgi:AmiR/NasT family two-component response regulator
VRVLIAEDDPLVALALAARLRELGHEVDGPHADGLTALARAEADPPELYLLDIGLPGLDGVALARTLAERGLRRPVVIVTGKADPELVRQAADAGVGAYLLKPVDTPALDAAVQVAAARHAELAAAEQRLEERKLVERAKDLLAETLGIGEAEAFRRLQRAARDRNRRLPEVARALLEQQDVLGRGPRRAAGPSPSI